MRDTLSKTLPGTRKECHSCPAISRLALLLDEARDDVTALQVDSAETRMALARLEGGVGQIPALLSELKDSLRHEIKSGLQVASATRSGRDIEQTTPRNWPSLKAGPVSWRGPTAVLLIAIFVAAGAYVAAEVWRPAKAAAK